VEVIYLPLCLVIASLLQISTNYFNDYYDWINGVDIERVGPERFSSNEITRKRLWLLAVVTLVICAICMIPLYQLSWWYLFAGLCSIYFSYGYTSGPLPLAYNCLGELFVFIFFGLVITMGSFYALTQSYNINIFIYACLFGVLNTVIISLNNFRDIETDSKVNKKTIATYLGNKKFKFFISGLILCQFSIELIMMNPKIVYCLLIYKLLFTYKIFRSGSQQDKKSLFIFGILNMLLSALTYMVII
jgi:1,4-dihydroxy-2-naphthoate octaprenyltransferase